MKTNSVPCHFIPYWPAFNDWSPVEIFCFNPILAVFLMALGTLFLPIIRNMLAETRWKMIRLYWIIIKRSPFLSHSYAFHCNYVVTKIDLNIFHIQFAPVIAIFQSCCYQNVRYFVCVVNEEISY